MNLMAREYATDADKVKAYNHRLKQAEDIFDQEATTVAPWVKRYENKPRLEEYTPKGHRTSVPTGTAIIDALFSSLTATDIDLIVTAIGGGTDDQEYLATAALSKEWDVTKANHRTAAAIKEALLIGIGWARVDYEYYAEPTEVTREDADIRADIEKLLQEAEDSDGAVATPDALQIAALVPVTEVQDTVLKSRIVVNFVPWDQLRVDPTATRLEDIRWYCQVQKLPADELQENPIYKAYTNHAGTGKKLKDLKGDLQLDLGLVIPDARPVDEDMRVTVYELHDIETGTVCTFAKGADWLLNEAPEPLAINEDPEDRVPFVPLVLRSSTTRVRGVSEMELMMPTLKELDIYHSRLATYLERYSPKIIAEKGAITEAGKRAMRSQEYGAVVEMEAGRVQDIKPFEPPQLPSEVYNVPDKLEQALRDATGVNELMRGLFPDRKRTATETAEVVTASAARQAEKRIQLERFYKGIARRILQLMQMFYTEDQLVRYLDYEGPIEWNWTADDIIFETKLEVALTPKEELSRQQKRDEGMMLLNTFGPLAVPDPQSGQVMVDKVTLMRIVGDKMGVSRKDLSQLIPTAFQQQQQMLANAQNTAQQAQAQVGMVDPSLTPGPAGADQLARATNQGQIPPEILAAAAGNVPGTPQAVGQVSENLGVKGTGTSQQ